MTGPLAGLKVLDLTIWQNGPWATVMLSDMGADVIKIEDPVNGDPGRNSTSDMDNRVKAYFETMNRNKRAMTLNLKADAGREVFYGMAKSADVVVQNFRAGVVEKLQVDYATVKRHNPRIVYASNTGLGSRGPEAHAPVMDILGLARSGFLYHSSATEDDISYRIPGGMSDQLGAIVMAYGILLGIVARERHGVGQHIEVSQLGSQITLQALAVSQFLMNGILERPQGQGRATMRNPLWNTYRCRDGSWLALGCNQADRYWEPVCAILGLEHFVRDPRYASLRVRAEHAPEVIAAFDGVFATQPRSYWLERLQARQVPCSPVQSYEDVAADPQVLANDYVVSVKHQVHGSLRHVGVPVRLSETPGGPRRRAPEYGEHTEEVLLEYGYDWSQIEEFRHGGVI